MKWNREGRRKLEQSEGKKETYLNLGINSKN